MVVFDASPLILLAKAELLERFLVSFSEPVVIPQVVEAECCENKALFDAQLIARLIAEKHIEVRKLSTGVQKFNDVFSRAYAATAVRDSRASTRLRRRLRSRRVNFHWNGVAASW